MFRSANLSLRLSLAALALTCFSCSKDQSETGSSASSSTRVSQLYEGELLTHAPVDTQVVSYWDYTGEAGKKYLASPWVKNGTAAWDRNKAKLLQALSEKQMGEPFEKIGKAFLEADIIPLLGGLGSSATSSSTAKGMVYGGLNQADALEAGLIIEASDPTKVSECYNKFVSNLKANQVEITDLSNLSGDARGFILPFPKTDAEIIAKAYVGTSGARLAFTSSETQLANALSQSTSGPRPKLVTSDSFKSLINRSNNPRDNFAFGYGEILSIASRVMKKFPSKDDKNSAEIGAAMAALPVGDVLINTSFKDSYGMEALASVSPKTDIQKAFFNALEKAKGVDLANKAPADAIFFFGLQGDIIRAIRDAALKLDPEQEAMLKPQLAVLDGVNSFGVGLRNGAAGVPFPELYFLLSTNDAPAIRTQLEQLVGMAIDSSNGMVGQLQSTEIDGAQVRYTSSPFGVGAYITDADGTIIIASSDGSIRAALSAVKGKSKTYASAINDVTKKALATDTSPLLFSWDMNGIATMLEGVQGSLSMFTGGKTSIAKEDIDHIRGLGAGFGSARYASGTLQLQQSYQAVPNAPNS